MSTFDVRAVQRLVQRARQISHFQAKYQGISDLVNEDTFLKLPSIDKLDLRAGFLEMCQLTLNERLGTYLFSSGGTTSQPLLSLIPCHMFIQDIIKHWRPLTQDDVLCNLYTPGRMWSAHYFYNALGEQLAARTIAFGPVQDEEISTWLDFFEQYQVTAIAGTPTTLKHILAYCSAQKRSLAFVRKFLWVGEAIDTEMAQLLRTVTPQVQMWGLYGSTETWVIGYNFPTCPFNTFHILPYQYVEIDQNRLLVTNLHTDSANIILRYSVGDAAAFVECPCDCGSPALQILGRNDNSFKLWGTLISPQEILGHISRIAKPLEAQLAVLRKPSGEAELEIRMVPHPTQEIDAPFVRQELLEAFFDIKYTVMDGSHRFSIVLVPSLSVNHRTLKTPMVVWEEVNCEN
jgi:phenylacetate-coenzyme A ligase PaaK-like adenylate-forming protein